jgi:hypothetical protein
MRKWLKRLFGGLLALLGLAAAYDVLTYSPSAWLSDYGRVKRDMAQGYANLDWIVEKRGLDLPELDRRTTDKLRSAHSHVRAFLALQDFVGAFRDPHLELSQETRLEEPLPAAEGDSAAGSDCASAGYSADTGEFNGSLPKLPGWRPLPGASFPAAVTGKTGFLRIGSFSETRYAAACERAFRPGIGERALQLATRSVLQSELRARFEALRKAGATRLVVDLTGNGGGSEWSTEAAALFTPRRLQRRMRLLVGPSCDRSAVWQGRPPPCAVFAPAEQELEALQGLGAWSGPVLILSDRGTASAAEEFIVWLHGSKAATLIGERTMGAGCGYVDGGNPSYLKAVPLALRMPNCARFLLDGTNEIEGSKPDVELPMKGDDARFAAGLRQALGGSF